MCKHFMDLQKKLTYKGEVDQGDCISLLLWIIFYEPLLKRIKKETREYRIETTMTPDLRYTYQDTMSEDIGGMAYIDDLAWIAETKEKMKRKIQIIESFFDMSSIKLNPNKSKLIVINEKRPN